MVRGRRRRQAGLSDAIEDGPLSEAVEYEEGTGPERRCLATGESFPTLGLIRFVIGPDGDVVPDLARRLPGRGMWLSARRDMVALAAKKGLFARAAKRKVAVPDGLADRIEALLLARCLDWLGLARRAGQVVAGFEKVAAELRVSRAAALIAASDGSLDGRGKLRALAQAINPGLPLVEALTGEELGGVFGRDQVVHAAMAKGRLAGQFVEEAGRLAGFRLGAPQDEAG